MTDANARRTPARQHRPSARATAPDRSHDGPDRHARRRPRSADDPGSGPDEGLDLEGRRRGGGPLRRLPGCGGARAGRSRGPHCRRRDGGRRATCCADRRAGDCGTVGSARDPHSARRRAPRRRSRRRGVVDPSDSRTHHLEPARIRLGHGLVADAPPRRERPRAADERARRLLGHHARRGHDRGRWRPRRPACAPRRDPRPQRRAPCRACRTIASSGAPGGRVFR